MTNGDRIRAMSDEELARLLSSIQSACSGDCPAAQYCDDHPDTMCTGCLAAWLSADGGQQ